MKLEFKVYELKETSKMYKQLIEQTNNPNEFILIGEKDNFYKTQQIINNGITVLKGLTISDLSFLVKKEDLEIKSPDGYGIEIQEFDIPQEYLTLDIIHEIMELNE